MKPVSFQLQVEQLKAEGLGTFLTFGRNTHLFKYHPRYFDSDDILNPEFLLILRVQTLLVVICWK